MSSRIAAVLGDPVLDFCHNFFGGETGILNSDFESHGGAIDNAVGRSVVGGFGYERILRV